MKTFLLCIYKVANKVNGWITSRRWAQITINLVLVAGIFLFVIEDILIGLADIRNSSISFHPIPAVYAFIILGVNYSLFLIGWNKILPFVGIQETWKINRRIYSSTQLAKVLPTPIWFIGQRIALYNREGVSNKSVLISTAAELLLHSALGLLVLLVLEISFFRAISVLWLFLILILSYIVIKGPTLLARAAQYSAPVSSFRNWLILVAVLLLTWIMVVPFTRFALESVGVSVDGNVLNITKIWIVASLAGYISSYTFGGGMIREFSLVFLLSNIFSPTVGLIIAVFTRLLITFANVFWPLLMLGLLQLFKIRSQKKSEEQ